MVLIIRGLLQEVFHVQGKESVTFGATGNGGAFVGVIERFTSFCVIVMMALRHLILLK